MLYGKSMASRHTMLEHPRGTLSRWWVDCEAILSSLDTEQAQTIEVGTVLLFSTWEFNACLFCFSCNVGSRCTMGYGQLWLFLSWAVG